MYLDMHIAGQRLARLRDRARASATREARRARPYTDHWELSGIVELASAEEEPEEADMMVLDRRRSSRSELAGSELLVRRIGGFNFQAGLKDVSTDGCRIELIEECEAGEDLITRFPQLEPLGAWVRWTLGPTCGVEFMRPIHPAVFKFLLARLGEQASAA